MGLHWRAVEPAMGKFLLCAIYAYLVFWAFENLYHETGRKSFHSQRGEQKMIRYHLGIYAVPHLILCVLFIWEMCYKDRNWRFQNQGGLATFVLVVLIPPLVASAALKFLRSLFQAREEKVMYETWLSSFNEDWNEKQTNWFLRTFSWGQLARDLRLFGV
jgi:hypothetical protein